jgi:archaellum component FlaC
MSYYVAELDQYLSYEDAVEYSKKKSMSKIEELENRIKKLEDAVANIKSKVGIL